MNTLQVGETRICKWKDNKAAAFSVGGDDSLRSQLYFAIPEMDKRGIRGTWWVNPGRGGLSNLKNQDDAWANCWIACYDDWKAAAARGHDFANHTMHHMGATSYAQAEEEISRTAQAIWNSNPGQHLQLFLRGGGTRWTITEKELSEILDRYDCVQGRGGGTEDPTWEINPSADTLRKYVDSAILEGSWHYVAFHGIGPKCEWGGPVDGNAFIALLDYLVEKRQMLWIGTHTQVHKYIEERRTTSISLLEATSSLIRMKLNPVKDPRLYDYPLTLLTRIPADWGNASVVSNNAIFHSTTSQDTVQFDAAPGGEEILITKG